MNDVQIAERLLSTLTGKHQVGLVYAKGTNVSTHEFFPSVSEARERVTALILDQTVTSFWVGAQKHYEQELYELLLEVSKRRGFGAVASANRNGKVWDLAF